MKGLITAKEAAKMIPHGAVVMAGGYLGCGNAHAVIEELARLGTQGLTLITNDASTPTGPDGEPCYGVYKLIAGRQVTTIIASHVGSNPEVAKQMNEGFLSVELLPQGSLAEMIRAGGSGLGGVLTPAGVGTVVEESRFTHSAVDIDGRRYLLMRPLRADVALLGGHTIDRAGNIWYKGTMRNFNPAMALAADLVIAQGERLVDVGAIEPENVVTPGILVDYVVEGAAHG